MNKAKLSNTYDLFFQIISAMILIICFVGTLYFFRDHIQTNLDSDEASELILAKLLSKEGKIITENWYYSTEIRVLNTNIPFSLFFKLTDNWYHVRLFATISMYIILLLTYYGLCVTYNLKKYFLISAALLFIPFSSDYYLFVLKGAYYFPHITFMIFLLMLAEHYIKVSGIRKTALLVITILLSIVLGMGGIRLLLIFFLPFLAAAIIMILWDNNNADSKNMLAFSFAAFCGSIAGFMINSQILSRKYHFSQWNGMRFSEIHFSRIEETLNSFLHACGYKTGSVFSRQLIHNIASFTWILLIAAIIFYAVKNHKTVSSKLVRLSVLITISLALMFSIYIFTDMQLTPRYFLPTIILSIPLTAVFIKELAPKWKPNLILLFMVFLAIASGADYFQEEWDYRPNIEIRRIARDLVKMGYNNGYATFWNGNLMTELTNGQIEIWTIERLKEITNIDQIYLVQQEVRHNSVHPEGKVFLLFTDEEAKINNWKNNLREEDVIIDTNKFIVYGFDSYDDLTARLYSG